MKGVKTIEVEEDVWANYVLSTEDLKIQVVFPVQFSFQNSYAPSVGLDNCLLPKYWMCPSCICLFLLFFPPCIFCAFDWQPTELSTVLSVFRGQDPLRSGSQRSLEDTPAWGLANHGPTRPCPNSPLVPPPPVTCLKDRDHHSPRGGGGVC